MLTTVLTLSQASLEFYVSPTLREKEKFAHYDQFSPFPTVFSTLFSSPEHKVLEVNYCDRSLSGVRLSVRPSVCVSVRPFVREQLLKKIKKFGFREKLWLPWQLKEKTLKIFLSQTVGARDFIFGM